MRNRRNVKVRRRNRVSEPDPSKEGPVSKGTGLQISSLGGMDATARAEIEAAFDAIGKKRPDALLVGTVSLMTQKRHFG